MVSSSRIGPTGLVGAAKAMSFSLTSTLVNTTAALSGRCLLIKCRSRLRARECPIIPCVAATHSSNSRRLGSLMLVSSNNRRSPTCGPFPWVITTLYPASSRLTTSPITLCSTRASSPGAPTSDRALPPIA